MTMDDIPAKPNPFDTEGTKFGDLVANKGLPPERQSDESLSPIDQKFKDIHGRLEIAETTQNPEAYASALEDLSAAMTQEVSATYISQYGDLAHTMMEWQQRNSYFINSHTAEIKAGNQVTRRSNTLNNQRRPHGVGVWLGDRTDQLNSQSFGEAVTEYIAKRGGNYITGAVVPGRSEQSEPHSVMQVETKYKGFGQLGFKDQGLAHLD